MGASSCMPPRVSRLTRPTAAWLLLCGTFAQPGYGAGAEHFQWIEAEDYTSITESIRLQHAERLSVAGQPGAGDAKWFLERSGWDADAGERVSGGAYVVMTAGQRFAPNSKRKELLTYPLTIPADGDYYIWVRCSSPPPCHYYFTVWLDTPEAPAQDVLNPVDVGYWNVWSWWPWGFPTNTGKAKAYKLSAGSHKLFIGHMSAGLAVDKILVTSNPDYVPYGISQTFFNGTFETLGVADFHNYFMVRKVAPKPSGWVMEPDGAWTIETDKLSGNHYLWAHETTAPQTTAPARAFIAASEYTFFKALARVLTTPGDTPDWNAEFCFDYQDEHNRFLVGLSPNGLEVVRLRDGQRLVLAQDTRSLPQALGRVLGIERGRSSLDVTLDGEKRISLALPLPATGQVGFSTRSGGIGLDDVELKRLVTPRAAVDFADSADPRLADWTFLPSATSPKKPQSVRSCDDDILVYSAPAWTNSIVHLEFPPDPDLSAASVLYPLC